MDSWMIFVICLSILFIFLIAYYILVKIIFEKIFRRMKSEILLTDVDLSKTHYKPFMDTTIHNMKEFMDIPYQEVSITSLDHLKLVGKYYDNHSDKTVLFIHGYHADPYNNACTPCLDLLKRGYNILLATERSHGKSEGKYITFGVKEKDDVLLWVDYINTTLKPKKLIVYGCSMGAGIVGMVSNQMPSNVKALVLDCGFTGTYEEVEFTVKRIAKFKPRLTLLGIRLFARIHGFPLEKNKAMEALSKTKIPCFFMHGTMDILVPYSMGLENYNAVESQKEWLDAECGHAVICYVAHDEIEKRLYPFLDKYMEA